MTVGDHLRKAWKHARKARKYADESNELAVAAMVEVARSYRLASEIPAKVEKAARPWIDLAEFNAALAEGFARDAEEYARKARELRASLFISPRQYAFN